jgi:hypothetical protein
VVEILEYLPQLIANLTNGLEEAGEIDDDQLEHFSSLFGNLPSALFDDMSLIPAGQHPAMCSAWVNNRRARQTLGTPFQRRSVDRTEGPWDRTNWSGTEAALAASLGINLRDRADWSDTDDAMQLEPAQMNQPRIWNQPRWNQPSHALTPEKALRLVLHCSSVRRRGQLDGMQAERTVLSRAKQRSHHSAVLCTPRRSRTRCMDAAMQLSLSHRDS